MWKCRWSATTVGAITALDPGKRSKMTTDEVAEGKLQHGTVARLNRDAGFGYVRDAKGQHSFIFLVGKALSHSQGRALCVGKPVRFRVSGQGRVDELVSD